MRKINLGLSEWESRVNELFSTAIICKVSHEKLMQMTDERVYTELNRTTASGRRVYTSYVSGYVQGLMTVHRALLYRNELEFCYLVDGVLYSTHKQSDKRTTEEFYQAGKGCILADAPSNHYWKHSNNPF